VIRPADVQEERASAPHREGPRSWSTGPGASRPAVWRAIPLALVIVTLVGSVAIPARQTWRITRLLRESTAVLSPARLLNAELQSGLAEELTVLQRYALTGDSALLRRYRLVAAHDGRRLAALARLSSRLDAASAGRVDALRRRIGAWRLVGGAPGVQPGSRGEVAVALQVGQARYDAALNTFGELSSALAAAAAARDDRVRALEHLSIASNAALVLAALVAMGGVASLTLRERRLAVTLQHRIEDARRRARQEAALREAAEALAGAYTVGEVTERIAHLALAALEGRGAFVERIVARPAEPPEVAVVRAVAGAGVPPLETTGPLPGSYTELVLTTGEPALIADLALPERPGTVRTLRDAGGSAIVVPLGGRESGVGALFVVRPTPGQFQPDDVARAGIFGHLATLAYEKVRLLEDAYERRRVLERVIQSRSRLIRGFSHDVKNPIGAADGFAELLCVGAYGALSAEQRASVERMRRNLRGALALIDDLHELARAETGNLALTSAPVDLAELVRTLCEEYHAAARAAGLSLSMEVELGLPIIETDGGRVRQIASNLLSNAIKYTGSGSVLVRATQRPTGPFGDAGDWALVEVVDTGPGIPSHKQGVIFEEFSRLGAGEQQGAGLGLAISKLLAQALGGHIGVQSESGQGSTFTLWLPLQTPERDARSPLAAASSGREPGPPP
jgi:signal transduction histidine kinase